MIAPLIVAYIVGCAAYGMLLVDKEPSSEKELATYLALAFTWPVWAVRRIIITAIDKFIGD